MEGTIEGERKRDDIPHNERRQTYQTTEQIKQREGLETGMACREKKEEYNAALTHRAPNKKILTINY